jgi:hypothetical protein
VATCSASNAAASSSARPRSPWSVIASSPAPLTSSAKSSSSTTQSCARRMPSPAPSSAAASAAWRWTSSPIRTARAPSRARATRANAGRNGRPCPRRLACPKGHAVCPAGAKRRVPLEAYPGPRRTDSGPRDAHAHSSGARGGKGLGGTGGSRRHLHRSLVTVAGRGPSSRSQTGLCRHASGLWTGT